MDGLAEQGEVPESILTTHASQPRSSRMNFHAGEMVGTSKGESGVFCF
jgi:hypothetical protein